MVVKILITGVAGFIGSHVARRLLARGDKVVGIDNLNDYYDPKLKEARLSRLNAFAQGELVEPAFDEAGLVPSAGSELIFEHMDITDRHEMAELFRRHQFDGVIHLAAQAGVRHSLNAPFDYTDTNITGFLTILEGCRHSQVGHLVYASTSSVYGANVKMPFNVAQPADHPVALYGATKRANELMAHSYSHLFRLPTTGLRFFTVYGPWGRPDMALFHFTKKILAGEPIDVFNFGNHRRDFTYVEDIAKGVVAALDHPPEGDAEWDGMDPGAATSASPWVIHNIGNQTPVPLMRYIELIERSLGKEAKKNLLPLQPGDVPDTYADTDTLRELTGYQPTTSVETGVDNFVKWYLDYYGG